MKTWTREKADLGPGPWQHEPDKIQFVDESTGLDCLIVRNHMGGLCGYVGVPEGHPMFGRAYSECLQGCDDEEGSCYQHSPEYLYQVHGGLTFSGKCQEGPPETEASRICHVPEPGLPANVWWFGFDCGHYNDLHPWPGEARSIMNDGRRVYQLLGPEGERYQTRDINTLPTDPVIYQDATLVAHFGYPKPGLEYQTYRNIGYVMDECKSLAVQLVRATSPV